MKCHTASPTITHTYTAPGGPFHVTAQVCDDDGAMSALVDVADVTVSNVGVVNGSLIVNGTDQNDNITVSVTSNGQVLVRIINSNPSQQTFNYSDITDRVIVRALGGNAVRPPTKPFSTRPSQCWPSMALRASRWPRSSTARASRRPGAARRRTPSPRGAR